MIVVKYFSNLIRKKLIELNNFKHYPTTDQQTRHERNATRLYLILLFSSITILTIYNLSQRSIQSKTIYNPTESEYLQLEYLYPRTLSCPCTTISMSYSTFIELLPYYHQLCFSDFISEKWMIYTQLLKGDSSFFLDYRGTANTHFQTLSMFCQEAHQTIDDARRIFLER